MSKGHGEKKVVITGRKMLKIIAVISIAAAVISAIIEVVRGMPILEVFTDKPLMWVGVLLPAFVILFLLGDEKKDKESENQNNKEQK